MEFLAICSHNNYTSDSTMGILSICSHTRCTRESAMGFLAIYTRTDSTRESSKGFLAICSHTSCSWDSTMVAWPSAATQTATGIPPGVPGHRQPQQLYQ